MNITDLIQLLSSIIALAAIAITFFTFKQQLKQSFFADYTKRYQEIMLHLPDKIFQESGDYNELDCVTKRYLRAYIDLCSEEFYLNKIKKLDNKVWENWKEGIYYAFNKKIIIEAWSNFNQDNYKDFSLWINDKVINRNLQN